MEILKENLDLILIVVYLVLLVVVFISYRVYKHKYVELKDDFELMDANFINCQTKYAKLESEHIVDRNYIKSVEEERDYLLLKLGDEPFTEEIKQCPECGNDMRPTKKMFICDTCKKRIRK